MICNFFAGREWKVKQTRHNSQPPVELAVVSMGTRHLMGYARSATKMQSNRVRMHQLQQEDLDPLQVSPTVLVLTPIPGHLP